jgi:hypothetical protein
MTILGTMMRWGAIIGVIGFLGGFIGPLIFTPDANQGPLLGIFITGPIGFLLGMVVGLILALLPRERWRS